jgi:outer membrane protein assembly factor BamB
MKNVGRIVVVLLAVACFGVRAADEFTFTGYLNGRPHSVYPDANPVAQWDAETNVIWKTEMPDWSNALPVVSGDRVFVHAEPSTLVCLDRKSGAILWQKTNTIQEAMTAEDEAKAKQLATQRADLEAKCNEAVKALEQAGQKLRQDRHNKELQDQLNKQRRVVSQLQRELEVFLKYEMPKTHRDNGYTSATSVADGERLYCFFGNGVGACYDYEGNRQWIALVERPDHLVWGHSSSPVLVDGKVFITYKNMHALDAATGKELFTVETGGCWGTPWVEQMGERKVMLTPGGQAVDVADGTVLGRDLYKIEWNGPVVVEGVLYIADDRRAAAYRMPEAVTENMQLEKLWESDLLRDRYYAQPLVHDGLLYAVAGNGKCTLTVFDAATGEQVYQQKLPFKARRVYGSPTLAGDHIMLNSDDGETLVFKPGRTFEQLSVNQVDKYRHTPVLDGDDILIRTYKYLWRIGKR